MKKLLAVLMLLLIAVPPFASAATLDLTDATLDLLKAWQVQIAERIAEIEAAPTPVPEAVAEASTLDVVAVTIPIPALKKGDKNDDVKVLQRRLADLGYYAKKVDGDYGSGVAAAIKTFQGQNGILQDGEANAETLAVLFSTKAKRMPALPDLEIAKVNVYKSYGTPYVRLDLVNNTDKGIDAFDMRIKAYDKYGERIHIFGSSPDNAEDELERSTRSFSTGKAIKAGGKKSMSKGEGFDLYSFENADKVEVAISRYHTSDGSTVLIPTNRWIWVSGDGAITFPKPDDYNEPVLTDEKAAAAEKFLLGITSVTMYDYIAELYKKPAGEYIVSVSDGPAADADIEDGDIIVSIDGIKLNTSEAIVCAKAGIELGETVEMVYYRQGEYYTTEVTRPE